MNRAVTEMDFRRPEFLYAKVEDYELRADGKVVRKDRWENGIRKIASILRIPAEWEISEVVQAVDALELAANPEYMCINPKCAREGRKSDFLSHDSGTVFSCPECSELVEPLDKKDAPNAPSNATEPVPNRPSAMAGASGPAVAENGSKAPESKGV